MKVDFTYFFFTYFFWDGNFGDFCQHFSGMVTETYALLGWFLRQKSIGKSKKESSFPKNFRCAA